MSVRSFTVFQDAPAGAPKSHDDGDAGSAVADAATTLLSTLAAIEKENLHPITGQRPGPTAASETKKRKTGVLATKVLVAPSTKKHKDLKAEPRKSRKPLSSSGKPRSLDGKKSASKSRSSRKASPLPPVVEEHESQRQPPPLTISQMDIDSRCYELTVSPLADVSEAYDATRSDSQEPDVLTQREDSVEPAIRDYFSPSTVDRPLPVTSDTQCNADDPSREDNDFSTPERKHIYSAFTFSSPSPSSERFKRAQSSPARHSSSSDSE